jgi:hypothetical protein
MLWCVYTHQSITFLGPLLSRVQNPENKDFGLTNGIDHNVLSDRHFAGAGNTTGPIAQRESRQALDVLLNLINQPPSRLRIRFTNEINHLIDVIQGIFTPLNREGITGHYVLPYVVS